MALLIGFRHEVGGDWDAYERYWQMAGLSDLDDIMAMSDPGYQLLNWLAQQAGVGVWGVNLACGLIFTWGLIRFARTQPFPWLVLVVAVPYLVTVVAMGYSRQAVAIGILMAGLASILRHGSLIRFAIYAVAAALFHKTSIIALPLVIFASSGNRLLTLIGGGTLIYALYSALLSEDLDYLVENYIRAGYDSQGALIRIILSVVPALIYFRTRGRLGLDLFEDKLWRLHSWAAIALLAAYFVSPSSTAVDRIALYIFPLQLAILARLPIAFPVQGIRLAIVAYSLAIQLVWLNFAAHADAWLPYSFYPF